MSPDLPDLKPKNVIKALENGGFIVDRIKGIHYIMLPPPLTVPELRTLNRDVVFTTQNALS